MRPGRARAGIAAAGLLAAALAGTALGDEPRYWAGKDLDVRPQVRSHVMPEYPKELPSGVRGTVILDVFISATGAVDRVTVVRAKPVNRFEKSATQAFSAAKYAPGVRKGKPVPSRLRVEVTYAD